jgi:cytochrome b involved in lipid metabolism
MTEGPKQFTMKKVKKNNYIVIDSNVYNFKEFEEIHPGGAKVLQFFKGKNATEKFHKVEKHTDQVKSNLSNFLIGTLQKE